MRTSIVRHYNAIIDALPTESRDSLYPSLELVSVTSGRVLVESGDSFKYAYFPADAIISMLSVLADGSCSETSIVGNEGIVGVSTFMGGGSTPMRAVVLLGGLVYRLAASRVREEFERHTAVRGVMLRYAQSQLAQLGQQAACNRHHSIAQQLCSKLLQTLDRVGSTLPNMTQESIANMLGVRREGVTEAACKLQRLGIITYHRGHITVLDRFRLENLCCECYQVIAHERARFVSPASNRPLNASAQLVRSS